MTPLIVAFPGNAPMAAALAQRLHWETGDVEIRQFPDGESHVRFLSALEARSVALVCTLDRPNDKLLPLLFAAAGARELGASRVGLVAPYLAYLRQDARFKPGEAVTSRHFARLLSGAFDWMVTVDPHLHRYRALDEIYAIPTRVVHAAPLISRWIEANVSDPLVIGPDRESEQWVAAVAADAGAPWSVLEKTRLGDRNVEIKLTDLSAWKGRAPVLVDDIVSSGRTMLEAARLLVAGGWTAPIAVAVHGLADLPGLRLVTTNTVPHRTNAIDVAPLLASPVGELAGI